MQNTTATTEEKIDLIELLYALLNRWYIILLTGFLCAMIGLLYTMFTVPETYQSKTSIYIYNQQSEKISSADLQIGYVLTKDYEVLVKSRTVLEDVIQKLNLNLGYGQLRGMISVSVPNSTRIVEISVVTTDPYLSRDIADMVRIVASQNIAEVMGVDAVNVVEEANLPEGKSGPNLSRSTVLGGCFGVALACGLILLMYFVNDTIRTQDDVERYLELSTLGVIPLDENLANPKKRKTKNIINNLLLKLFGK